MTKILAIINPLLFAAYAVLAVLVRNLGDVPALYSERSLVVSVTGAVLLILAFYLVLKDWVRAGLITSVLVILFFSYGHLYSVASSWELGGIVLGRHSFMLPLWLMLSGVWVWLVTRKLQNPQTAVNFFSIFSLILVIFPAYTVVGTQIRSSRTGFDGIPPASQSESAILSPIGETAPDIYYIILDGYGRQDILKELYDYDNSPFINGLVKDGFYVAGDSHTNYIKTLWSLSSALNMEYINYFADLVGRDSKDKAPLEAILNESQVQNLLRDLGYQIIGFDSGYVPVTLTDADILYSARAVTQPFWSLNEFEGILVGSTLARVFQDLGLLRGLSDSAWFQELGERSQYEGHRDRINFTLDKLVEIAGMEGQQFTLAHIIVPHPPFVFGSQGEKLEPDWAFTFNDGSHYPGTKAQYIAGYRNQLIYMNSLVRQTLDDILSRSDVPPVIILQGDHGPGAYLDWESLSKTNLPERLSILNAYYMAGGECDQLYSSITPVNTFRVVFNCLFNAEFELVEDKSYYMRHSRPYDFTEVTDQLTKD